MRMRTKKKIHSILLDVMYTVSFLGMIVGLIMCIGEYPGDIERSNTSLFMGAVLFFVFSLPLIIKSVRGSLTDDSDT